ncbi:hypothetical protein DERP_009623, partial [Dermatophagoides pteronyssinus]
MTDIINTGSISNKISDWLLWLSLYTKHHPEIRSPPPIGYDGYRRVEVEKGRYSSCFGGVTTILQITTLLRPGNDLKIEISEIRTGTSI